MAEIFEDDFIDFSYSTVGGAITANITPFSHNVVTNTSNDGSTINYTYTFAQAYIITNSPFDSRASGVISGMGDAFTIPVDEDIEFQVKVTLSKQNYKVLGTEFFTGLPSEEGKTLEISHIQYLITYLKTREVIFNLSIQFAVSVTNT